MTYGFRPENWAAFEHELRLRGIAVNEIEKVEIRSADTEVAAAGTIVTVTLRSGRIDSWSQQQAPSLD
jgi:hypothetical protein